MSTGGTGADAGRLFKYGSSTAGPNVDLTDDQAQGTHTGYQRGPAREGRTSSVVHTLKEALRPNDAKRFQAPEDTTHDGRQGGIVEAMKPGNQDHDVCEERRTSSGGGGGGGSVTGIVEKALGRRNSPPSAKQEQTDERPAGDNYNYSDFPSMGSPKSTFGKGSEIHDRATPRVSVFDSQGTIGHQFTSEGAVGSVGEKVGGPFSKEGAIGKQFTDSGAVGGTIHDTLGHANTTRKGL